MDKHRIEELNKPFRKAEEGPTCAVAGCTSGGLYPAPLPKGPTSGGGPGRDFQWLCLEHVRAFNAAWNNGLGQNEEAIEAQRREDAVWGRPSWPFSSRAQPYQGRPDQAQFRDPFGFMGEEPAGKTPSKGRSEEEKALSVLGLGCAATRECVKTRYKELVKKLHPDANGRDSHAEERLKEINQAYATLKTSFQI